MHQCFKCRQAIGTIASRDGPAKLYCPDCFLAYCAGAVRENAFRHCRVPSDVPLAVAVSGGPNSMMLLHELGQLRYTARDHLRRQPLAQQRWACAQGRQSDGASASSSSAASASSVSNLILLPFHLCEDELVLPSPPSPPPQSSSFLSSPLLHESSGRHEAIEKARSTMEEQFKTLRKYALQQPPRWAYRDEAPSRRSSAKKKRNKMPAAVGTGAARADSPYVAASAPPCSGDDRDLSPASSPQHGQAERGDESTAPPARLYDAGEVRLFYYSDFLGEAYRSEVRHALHASRLPLSDREALYARVRQQTLCRAAHRLCTEYLLRASGAAVVGGPAHEEVMSRSDEAQCSAEHEPFEERASVRHANLEMWPHLVLGSNAVRCATAALDALVTGASGEGVVHGSGFRGYTHEVVCLRPLRTMLPKETIMYTRLCGILGSYTPALRTSTTTRSIHRTLEQFVLTMMASYRTMIFNVLNTVQRLEVHPAAMQEVVRGTSKSSASQAHEKRDGSAAVGSSQLGAKTTKKPLPSGAAQQNRDDLLLEAPLHVHRDLHTVTSQEVDIKGSIVMCCVCGCPASLAACHPGEHRSVAARQLELFALSSTTETLPCTNGASSTSVAVASPSSATAAAVGGCFICYACRSLAEAWPPSAFGRESATKSEELDGGNGGSAGGAVPCRDAIASAVFQLGALFH
ncbi:hypothetical protein LSCM1_05893 [Leishmania martiniquensis]|uniref:Cytoplasmic tRNA 2-thiolation protein 2 n=1 Tax=Leishmania martiniquensis TaxID=1580590 RepID=A0A836KQQ9_9TRYP|nr:hypothetical protein LSCM1_05893 [Leishmania martiniquensis]